MSRQLESYRGGPCPPFYLDAIPLSKCAKYCTLPQRNGYRERALVTSVGTINLRIPKLRRGSYFPEDLLVRYSGVDRAVVAAVSEMVTCGVSTRKVERVASAMDVDRMSSSQVSRICESLDETVADLQERDLSDVAFPYIWVDATYVKCRDGGHVSSCALVTAIGAGADGHRRLLGVFRQVDLSRMGSKI